MRKTGLKTVSFLFAMMLVSLTCMPFACAATTEVNGVASSYEEAASHKSVNATGSQRAAFVPVLIGLYSIGGYEIALYVGGVIGFAGLYYYSGTIYDWLMGLIHSSYQDAKQQGTQAGHHEVVTDSNSFGRSGPPESSRDYVPAGVVKQRRYYDRNGNAEMDIDFYDNNPPDTHIFPHRHNWVNGVRGDWYTI